MELVQFTDVSVFKEYCLDRLAAGITPDIIAQDVSASFGHIVPAEQVVASNTVDEILARRKEMLAELKASAPVISRDLLSVMGRIKKFLDKAESAFANSDERIEDFDSYRRSIELQLKAIDTASKQLGALNDSTKVSQAIIISFGLEDLKRLEASGAVKIIDTQLAGDLIGNSENKN